MGRSLATAETPVLGSTFANSNSPSRLIKGDGTVYIAKVPSSGASYGLVNSTEFPKAAAALASNSSLVALGAFNTSVTQTFLPVTTQSDYGRAFTYGVHLAKSATIFQSNKTENYYGNGVDYPNVGIIGQFRIGMYPGSVDVQLAAYRYNGTTISSANPVPNRQLYAHYYDTVNSANVWLCLNEPAGAGIRISTTDGINFTTSSIGGAGILTNRYTCSVGAFRPVAFVNGDNGLFITRLNNSGVAGTDEAAFFRTTNNFATTTDVTGTWYTAGTNRGYPCLFNYDGTTVFAMIGDSNGINVFPKWSTNLGSSVSASTVTGDTTSFRGIYGTGGFNGIQGAGMCHCTGANASQFMYISFDQANNTAFSYYTSNGGQTFTSKSLLTQLNQVTTLTASYDGFICLNYNGGRWVALFQKENFGIYSITSTDNGATWSNPSRVFAWNSSYPAETYNGLAQVFSNSGTFVAVKSSGQGVSRPLFMKSTNGSTWTEMTDPYATFNEVSSFIETSNSFIVLGRVIDKSTMNITGFTNQPGPTNSYPIHYLTTPNNKFVSIHYNLGTALVTDSVISSGTFTTSVGSYVNSYTTSGSAYGSFEYQRVK